MRAERRSLSRAIVRSVAALRASSLADSLSMWVKIVR
jgi:hypothetical protein